MVSGLGRDGMLVFFEDEGNTHDRVWDRALWGSLTTAVPEPSLFCSCLKRKAIFVF